MEGELIVRTTLEERIFLNSNLSNEIEKISYRHDTIPL